MKFPNNIILDISKKNFSLNQQYWIYKYLLTFKKNTSDFDFLSFTFHKFLIFNKENLLLNKLIKNENKFTIKYKNSKTKETFFFLNKNKKNLFKKLFSTKVSVKKKNIYSNSLHKKIYDFFYDNSYYNQKLFKKILNNFSIKKKNFIFSNFSKLFDINFLKKEKIYTKLKYSRVPQYDIVSGGVAAIFAGFLGFLVCEKFGFELIDSGDFYFLFMYLVFFFFLSRLYLKLINFQKSMWNVLSFKWLIFFYKNIIILILKICKIK